MVAEDTIVRNDEVVGSIPTSSTIFTSFFQPITAWPEILYRRLTEVQSLSTITPGPRLNCDCE
jgi:hypothetical protein